MKVLSLEINQHLDELKRESMSFPASSDQPN
jgi:hypothetical protein